MPKESVIRKKAIDLLEADGFVCWYPYKARYAKEVDIFGVFDLIAINKFGVVRLIQLTDYTSISKRYRKIISFVDANGIEIKRFMDTKFEVWGWNRDKKEFKRRIVE